MMAALIAEPTHSKYKSIIKINQTMKKSIILAVLLSLGITSQAQFLGTTSQAKGSMGEPFTYGMGGLNQFYSVNTVDSMSQSEMYDKALNWVKESYSNPDEVIQMTMEGERIRFQGATQTLFSATVLGSTTYYMGKYTISLEFKDGKYKFEVLDMTYYSPPSDFSVGGWKSFKLRDGSYYYKSNGSLRKTWGSVPIEISGLLNGLNESLFEYLTESSQGNSSKDW